jgi:hypothetical protein
MTYTMPNLTSNHIDANGNLILPGSHTPNSTSPTASTATNQTASINRNSTNSSTLGGEPVPLDPNAIPLEPNRTIINTTTNRTKPLYTGTSSGGNRVLQSIPSREQQLPDERFIIEYRVRIRGKDDSKETWREVTRGFEGPGEMGNSIAQIECRRVGTK